MKKIIQSKIFSVLICGILFTSIGVYAANYYAKDVTYEKKDGTQTTVNDALDELYSNKVEKILIKENYECNSKNKNNILSGGYGGVMVHTIDVTDIEGYEKFTADNFIIEVVGVSGSCNAKTYAAKQTSKEYDPETGILTLSNYGHIWNQQTNNGYSQNYVTVDIWLIK